MDILFLSHCVPYPPDKGEKIRAFHELVALTGRHRVHLACFARKPEEIADAQRLSDRCASVSAYLIGPAALPKAALRFALGGCLNMAFYWDRRMKQYVNDLARRVPLAACVAYSVVMAPYTPAGVPMVLDMLDVDSEKWFQYARNRWPGFLYGLEARRLRAEEVRWAGSALRSLFTTRNEEKLFRSFGGNAPTTYMENGVDFEFFDPAQCPAAEELAGRRFVVFVGTMDYWPNIDAACWFAESIFPELRRRIPDLEFFIVGRNPAKPVLALAATPGVTVTGAVADVRVYLKHARAFVAPLRIARGIQNKVLEALAMGKTVLASTAVCATFGEDLPAGILRCESEREFIGRLSQGEFPPEREELRRLAYDRFGWPSNTRILVEEVEGIAHGKAR